MIHSIHHKSSLPKQIMRLFAIVLAVGGIAGAIWVIGSAVLENIHFAEGTSQMLNLVTKAHGLAARDKTFAMQPNEDILFDFMRIGILTEYSNAKPVILRNPWNGPVKSFSPTPSNMRIETYLPNHDCRRLALFFVKNSTDLGLKVIEVKGDDGPPVWQRIYAPADGINVTNTKAIEDGCDRSPMVTLAFILTVR